MIAALSITVYLLCGAPQVVHVEMGGEVRLYDVVAWQQRGPDIRFVLASDPAGRRFYEQAYGALQERGEDPQLRRAECLSP